MALVWAEAARCKPCSRKARALVRMRALGIWSAAIGRRRKGLATGGAT
eukprot:CAMPEP_0176227964 /NCGR_PEP_ID=MMETSP0121_2-20121125/23031_1 /TAXON_ID=160619 /ORGANISM="Kryptoperidinium foliaceum, Strain CCMP 1326" /LENGTH=47 /DNA_ID= /DNA_START= /DNA_END= /DNA_ORIENTATION=